MLLFMIIIGGLGSILGSFLGAAFIVLLPVLINNVATLFVETVPRDLIANVELMVFGGLDYFLPHRRALWAGALMADDEGKTPALAVSALK